MREEDLNMDANEIAKELVTLAFKSDKAKLAKTINDITNNQIVTILPIAMLHCKEVIDELEVPLYDKAFKRIEKSCPSELLQEIQFNALNDYALNNNEKLHPIAERANEKNFMKVVNSFVQNENKEAIERAVKVCNKNVVKEAIMTFARENNEKAIELLKDACQPNLFQEACFEAITEYAISNNTDFYSLIPFSSSDTVSDIIIDCLETKNDEALKRVKGLCTPELIENIHKNALQDFAVNRNYEKFDLAEKASTNVFANALERFTKDKDKKAIKGVVMVCPHEKAYKIFEIAMNKFAKDKEAIELLTEVCDPSHLKKISNKAMIDYVENQNESVRNIAQLYTIDKAYSLVVHLNAGNNKENR